MIALIKAAADYGLALTISIAGVTIFLWLLPRLVKAIGGAISQARSERRAAIALLIDGLNHQVRLLQRQLDDAVGRIRGLESARLQDERERSDLLMRIVGEIRDCVRNSECPMFKGSSWADTEALVRNHQEHA